MQPFNIGNLRIPLIPFSELDRVKTEGDLITLFSDRKYMEAIYLASPSLYDELSQGKRHTKLYISLTKYLERAASRSTPFGLFASCSAVNIGNPSVHNAKFAERKHCRLDMNYLCALAFKLAHDPHIRTHLIYYPNTSLYSISDQIRFTETFYSNSDRKYYLSGTTNNYYIDQVINNSRNGATFSELLSSLGSLDVPGEEAQSFLFDLINAQIIVSELEPPASGTNFLEKIISTLEKVKNSEADKINGVLKDCAEKLLKLNSKSESIADYVDIASKLETLGVPIDPQKLFQVDFYRDTDFIVQKEVADQVLKGIEILSKLTCNVTNRNLSGFKKAFQERYEEREVPLMEVMDVENGLGYPYADENNLDSNPLLNNFSEVARQSNIMELKWHPVHRLLLSKVVEAASKGVQKIEVTENDLSAFKSNPDFLNDSFASLVSVVEYTDNKNFQILIKNAGGSSAMNQIGRFCDGNPRFQDLAKNISDFEKQFNKDVVIAEINHIPESRTGNVVFRPHIRDSEISFLASRSLDVNRDILLSDILVSLNNNNIVLRSKVTGKYIIPRMANSHNFMKTPLPVYNFLCDLQSQFNQSFVSLDLNFIESQFDFIPRIYHKNFIFSPAKWKIKTKALTELFESDDVNLLKLAKQFSDENKMPKRMLLVEGDNHLYLNWESLLSVKAFLNNIRKQANITLTEFLFNPEAPFIKVDGKGFTNELLLCFHKERKLELTTQRLKPIFATNEKNIRRNYLPGSEWLYLKLYSGVKSSDRILNDTILPIVKNLKDQKLVKNFFFIRYNDPKNHLRLRFQLSSNSESFKVLNYIHNSLRDYFQNAIIYDLKVEVYRRELERYGPETIEGCEEVFGLDSLLALEILPLLRGEKGDEERWKICGAILNIYLRTFFADEKVRNEFVGMCAQNYEKEFNSQKTQKVQIDNIFRMHRQDINRYLGSSSEIHVTLNKALREFESNLSAISIKIIDSCDTHDIFKIVQSLIHMHCNRFFRSKQRLQEYILYSLLDRYYKAEEARKKKTAVSTA